MMYARLPGDSKIWVDPSTLAKVFCLIGYAFTWLVICAAFVFGIGGHSMSSRIFTFSEIERHVLSIGVSLLTTACNETMGYIHTVSLRWALFNDGKLEFNSNLRLWSHAPSSPANSRIANLICFLGVVVSYSSGSIWLMRYGTTDTGQESDQTIVVPQACIAYGIGLLMQAIVVGFSIPSALRAPTFSCSPLDTAAATVVHGMLQRRPGRCMMGLDQRKATATPSRAVKHQKSLFASHRAVRYVLFAAWTFVLLAIAWLAINSVLVANGTNGSRGSGFFEGTLNMQRRRLSGELIGMTFQRRWTAESDRLPLGVFAWVFSFVTGLQIPLTLMTHLAELVVNSCRDESTWRQASGKKGLQRKSANPIVAIMTSASALALFLFKAQIHVQYSNAMSIVFHDLVTIRTVGILGLAIGAALLSVFLTVLSIYGRKGPQPSTFGHLQTLVDLIDEWPEKGNQQMYWGHKTGGAVTPMKEEDYNFAGISITPPAQNVRIGELYS
ncbi:unnamed protein product [Tilletia controversa]|uniref:Uncharacterized protein n=1 Tax=Tilletia controversa TaxID=13291 RepID=A0A8X7T0S8_9BASI|nr:hypothetical protein A4X06_0g779 [Tilletia controversa]CAD6971644.1 unnamed protein product [Tilletia controversa]